MLSDKSASKCSLNVLKFLFNNTIQNMLLCVIFLMKPPMAEEKSLLDTPISVLKETQVFLRNQRGSYESTAFLTLNK